MDLDQFTRADLTRMSEQAAAAAVAHYARATALTADSALIPYRDKATWAENQAQWRAAMAAGNEQEELCRAIGEELRMRDVCDA